MWLTLLSLAAAAVGSPAADSTPRHAWIADVKANRATLGKGEVRLEGDVVDVRSTSPTARKGIYRLIDTSDRDGVLVRTARLPKDGGAFRIRAALAPEQPADGGLLFDELGRTRLDGRPVLPVVLAVFSGVTLVVLAVLLGRAVAAERRYIISPPLWLMPDAGPYGKALAAAPDVAPDSASGTAPALKFRPDLEEADRRHRALLKRRKRSLLNAMLGDVALAASSLAWVAVTKPVAAQMPAFIFIDARDAVIPPPAPSVDTVLVEIPPVVYLDSPPRRRDSSQGRKPGQTPAARESTLAQAVLPPPPTPGPETLVVMPPPAPAPSPAPTPPPAPSPPPRDPEMERQMAEQFFQSTAARLTDAINGRQMQELAVLIPEALAPDPARRNRFMKLVRENNPRASLRGVEGTTLAGDKAEARFSVAFVWRGDFGVETRKTARLLGTLIREDSGWRFEGARLLDPIP